MQILRWLRRDDSPLLFRLRMDPAQWLWGARFLAECLPSRTRDNIAQIVRLALYSRASLQELRAATGIEYDALTRGILHYYTEREEFDRAVAAASIMNAHGLDREVKTVAQAIAIEPALAAARERIVGARIRRPTNRGTRTSSRASSRALPRRRARASSTTTRSRPRTRRRGGWPGSW